MRLFSPPRQKFLVPLRSAVSLPRPPSGALAKPAVPQKRGDFWWRWLLWGFLLAFGLTVLAVVHIWQQQRYVALGYRVQQLRFERQQIRQQLAPLQAEIAHLERPQRLVRIGSLLGLSAPKPEQLRRLSNSPFFLTPTPPKKP